MSEIRLDTVVMPVIMVMNDPNLSWSQRETCASAIKESLKQYSLMMEAFSSTSVEAPAKPMKPRG